MTDQNALADKVQKIAAEMRAAMRREDDAYRDAEFLSDMSGYIRDLDKLCARARPRLEWPGDTPTGPGHLAVGTVIESADDPRIDALPVGSILLDRDDDSVTKRDGAWSGNGFSPIVYERDRFGPWTVLHIPKEAGQ